MEGVKYIYNYMNCIGCNYQPGTRLPGLILFYSKRQSVKINLEYKDGVPIKERSYTIAGICYMIHR